MIHESLDSTGCPNLELLAAYSLGKLAHVRLEAVANHISTCPRCESLLPELPPLEDDFVASLRRWGSVASESLLDGGHSLLVLPKQVEIPSPGAMNREAIQGTHFHSSSGNFSSWP